MSHPPYMPWWIGDYLRDTQHLTTEQHGAYLLLLAHCWQHQFIPDDATARAHIARLTGQRWNKIKAPIEAFFAPNGTHGRVNKELARLERLSIVRRIAGAKGGAKSYISRVNQTASKSRAPPQANTPANTQPNSTANQQQKSSNRAAYQTKNQNLTSSSESLAASAREDAPQQVIENEDKSPAGELATALRGGALTRPPDAEKPAQESKPPSEVKRAEFDAMFAARRKASNATGKEETDRS